MSAGVFTSRVLCFTGATVAVRVSTVAADTMREIAAASFPLETGGVLVGRYLDDLRTAEVLAVTGPCADAVHGLRDFNRGSDGLSELLAILWECGFYYLGDWHTHPASDPTPSETDLDTLRATAERPQAQCPEPALLILGGIAGEASERWSATLWRRGGGVERLTGRGGSR